MARQNLGSAPTRPQDYVDVSWVTSTYPSTSLTVPDQTTDYTIVLPNDPPDHAMFLVEVNAAATIIVSVPGFVVLTTGTSPFITIYSGKTGFFGFRYSASVGSWFLLSATSQV